MLHQYIKARVSSAINFLRQLRQPKKKGPIEFSVRTIFVRTKFVDPKSVSQQQQQQQQQHRKLETERKCNDRS